MNFISGKKIGKLITKNLFNFDENKSQEMGQKNNFTNPPVGTLDISKQTDVQKHPA